MLQRIFGTLHMRLVLFVIAVMAPAIGLIVYNGFEQRRLAAEEVKAEALRTTHIVTSYQEQMILWTHQVLRNLAQIPAVQENGKGTTCNEEMQELLLQYPSYTQFAAATPDGKVFCSSSPGVLGDIGEDVSEYDWFLRSIQIRKFVVSDVAVNPSNDKTVQLFGYPYYDKTGKLIAVVGAGLDVDQLNEFATRAQLRPGSVITMFDRHGTILARYPKADEWVGQTIPDAPLVKTILAAKGEGTAELPGLDGQQRLCAYTYLRFNQQGLYLNVGVPARVAFEAVDKGRNRNIMLLAVIIVVEIVIAGIGGRIFVLRPIRVLAQGTQRVSEGDLNVQLDTSSGMGELQPLAKSFNAMVSQLQQHESYLRDAESRYRKLVEQIPSVIYTLDMEKQTMRYISPRIEAMLGISAESLLGDAKAWQACIANQDQEIVLSAIAHSRKTGESLELEYRLVQQDGSIVWVRDEGVVLPDEHGTGQRMQGTLSDITEHKRAEEVIQEQEEVMQELSTPLLHIGDKILLMPVVGALDSRRALQMMETLLKGVEETGTKVVILDITGVAVVDSQVANAIIQTEHAVRLLGARVVLTGIRPEVAQAMVGLGVDLGDMITEATLESGIAYAIRRT